MTAADLAPAFGGDPIAVLLDALRARQWGFIDGWFEEPLLRALRAEALRSFVRGAFRSAGVGRGSSFQIDSAIRSDEVMWIDPAARSFAQQALASRLDELRTRLNQSFFVGLRDFEAHFTVYRPGRHYDRHIDRFAGDGHRRVSFVLYLNRRWSLDDGGALRIFDPAHHEAIAADLLPAWGRMAVFFSETVPHEVLVTHRRRVNITGWFRDG